MFDGNFNQENKSHVTFLVPSSNLKKTQHNANFENLKQTFYSQFKSQTRGAKLILRIGIEASIHSRVIL